MPLCSSNCDKVGLHSVLVEEVANLRFCCSTSTMKRILLHKDGLESVKKCDLCMMSVAGRSPVFNPVTSEKPKFQTEKNLNFP